MKKLGLVPGGHMEDIVRGAIGLATEGFFEAVETGSIAVRRDRTITRLLERDGKPCAELDDGTVLPADLVVCATGFTQGVPFLPSDVQSRLLDERGNFVLYRQIRPVGVPGLYVDEVLGDLDLNIPVRVRAAHWLNPINPAAYRRVTPKLVHRLQETAEDGAEVLPLPIGDAEPDRAEGPKVAG